MFNCGAANFARMDPDESPPPTPKASASKKKHNKNPYSARGLDKFSMVLAELETRREKIIEKTGAQGVAMIQFMCDNSQDWVPIIVRPKGGKASELQLKKLPAPPAGEASQAEDKEKKKKQEVEDKQEVGKKQREEKRVKRVSWDLGWRESYSWPLVMVMILLCLVMFGRVFAICCTCVWWYVAPAMKEKERCLKRKEIERRLSNKRLASPRAHGNIGKKNRVMIY